jgi:ABC-type antimicrobial peptide transport system permease subunit
MPYLVRASGNRDGAALIHAIRERLAALNPATVIKSIDPVPTLVERSYAEERYRTLLGSLFGIIGSVLAAVGMFGVISRTVARRMREAGIRVALGAPAPSLTRLMLRETVTGAVIGIAIGIPLAILLAGSLTPYLFGVRAFDPVAYLLALGLLTLATAVATIPPARRAARVDPVSVLRAD